MPSLIPLLEAAAADFLHGYVAALRAMRPGCDAECLAVGLAAACYAGVGNPITTVKGLGPRIGEEDVMLRATGEGSNVEAEPINDVDAWARALALSFNGEVNEFWLDLGVSIGSIEGSSLLGIREADELVAAAQLAPGLRVATFCCDGTVDAARGKGYQRRLIEARLGIAQELGLDWCTSEVAPGSGSQRNYVRCGFEKIYSRFHWTNREV